MKILLACEFYYPSVGGVQEVMRQLAERFVERGHQVTVATSFLPERTSRLLNGVEIAEFNVSGNLVRGLGGDVEAYRRYVIESGHDVFMVKAAQQWTFDALISVLDRIRKPKVFIPCGFSGLYEPAYADYFRQMPEALRKFDRLIFYALDYRDINFAREHGIKNFVVIPNGASEREFGVQRDSGFRRRHRIPGDVFLILTVGSLTGMKGHLELAQAFERCEFSGRPAFLLLNGNRPRLAFSRYGVLAARMLQILVTARTLYRLGGLVRLSKWILRSVLLTLRLGWVLRAFGYSDGGVPETIDAVVARINNSRSGVQPRAVVADLPRAELVQAYLFGYSDGDVPETIDAVVARINNSRSGVQPRAVVADLPRAELVQAYLNSDLFVFVSKVEYSPLVLYEAAAAGLPFLSVSVGNAGEIASWTGGGIVFDAPKDAQGYTQVDPAALAECISRLAARPDELARLGAEGRKNWEARFSWNKIVTLYEGVLNECIASVSRQAD